MLPSPTDKERVYVCAILLLATGSHGGISRRLLMHLYASRNTMLCRKKKGYASSSDVLRVGRFESKFVTLMIMIPIEIPLVYVACKS